MLAIYKLTEDKKVAIDSKGKGEKRQIKYVEQERRTKESAKRKNKLRKKKTFCS